LTHEALCLLKGDPLQDEVSLDNGRPSLYREFQPIYPTNPTLPLRTVQNSGTDFALWACTSRVLMKASHPNTSDFPLFSVIDRLSLQFQSSIAYSLFPLLSLLIAAFPDLKATVSAFRFSALEILCQAYVVSASSTATISSANQDAKGGGPNAAAPSV
jgi:hypothetical protein